MSYLKVKSRHTTILKHRILNYYLECVHKAKFLDNWTYIETHGASGVCLDQNNQRIDGSPLIIHRRFPDVPKSICELHRGRFKTLKEQFSETENVELYNGDCNDLIDLMHDKLESKTWYLHFVDPAGVRESGHDELTFDTLRKIAQWRNSELLLNFPLLPFTRWGSYSLKGYDKGDTRSLTRLYGSEKWKRYYCVDKRLGLKWNIEDLADGFIEMLQPFYDQSLSKYLVRNEYNAPMYYLIHGTNNKVGKLFMTKAFAKAESDWIPELKRSPKQPSLNHFT